MCSPPLEGNRPTPLPLPKWRGVDSYGAGQCTPLPSRGGVRGGVCNVCCLREFLNTDPTPAPPQQGRGVPWASELLNSQTPKLPNSQTPKLPNS